MRLRSKERERLQMHALTETEKQIEEDFSPAAMRARFPRDWHEICDLAVPKKDRITLRVDRDVVAFFRAMGEGYQTKMNRVLRSFMLARLNRLVDGPETEPAPEVEVFDFDKVRAVVYAKLAAEAERKKREG